LCITKRPPPLALDAVVRNHPKPRRILVMIEVKIDFARCDANGTCAALMPDVFQIADNGLLEQLATTVPDDRDQDLDEVILCCPMGAISRA
jgi:ferredoxin